MQLINRKSLISLGFMGISLGAIVSCSSNSTNPNKMINNPSNSPASSGINSSPSNLNSSPAMMGTPGSMNHSMMDLGPADVNYDLRFIDGMIVHHQGAVVMAQEAQQKSSRPEIKKLAADIITAQQKEIAQMKAWRTT